MRLRRLAHWIVVVVLAASGLCLSVTAIFSLGMAGYRESSVALDKAGDSRLDVPIYKLVESGGIDMDKALAEAGYSGGPGENEGTRRRALNAYLLGDVLRREAEELRSQALWCAVFAAVNFLGCGTLAVSLRS